MSPERQHCPLAKLRSLRSPCRRKQGLREAQSLRSFVPSYCLLRHRCAITRIQQATSLFPGRGGHVPSDLLSALASRKQNTSASRRTSAASAAVACNTRVSGNKTSEEKSGNTNGDCRSPYRMLPERQHCPLAKLRSLRSLRPLPPSASSCQRRTRTRRAPPPARSGGGDVRYGAFCLRRPGHRQPASAGRAKHEGVSGGRLCYWGAAPNPAASACYLHNQPTRLPLAPDGALVSSVVYYQQRQLSSPATQGSQETKPLRKNQATRSASASFCWPREARGGLRGQRPL